ncbi:MAG: MAPEG family protein [Deltaproteobacteria bacterium]|nr:MAG: MAPEG family protein [Deltaproteobacteria bacterium]
MTTPFVCILIAMLLAWPPKLAFSIALGRSKQGYDNKQPRAQQAALRGWMARARDAHYNTLEAFPPFAAGVIVAHLAGLDEHRATVLAVTFVVARTVYPILYIANLDLLRSAVWGVGYVATLLLYVLPWIF